MNGNLIKWLLCTGGIVVLLLFVLVQRRELRRNQNSEIADNQASANVPQIQTSPVERTEIDSKDVQRLRREALDVHRLRGEVTVLRQEMARLTNRIGGVSTNAAEPGANAKATPTYEADRILKKEKAEMTDEESDAYAELVGKETQAKQWWEALRAYAKDHDGVFPKSLNEASVYLPGGFQNTFEVTNIRLGIGAATRLDTLGGENPGRTVVFSERTGMTLPDGRGAFLSIFADGNVMFFEEPVR